MNMAQNLEKFIKDQLSIWGEVSNRFRDLRNVSTRTMNIGGLEVTLQHNPARLSSATARIDEESLKARECFLCPDNQCAEQIRMRFVGRKGRKYNIQINPFPIFPRHLVIPRVRHCEQSIWHHFVDMLDLSKSFSDYIFFYNGPKCGASAPDHMHFQGAPRHLMPLERSIDSCLSSFPAEDEEGKPSDLPGKLEHICSLLDAHLYHYKQFTRGIFVLRARTAKSMGKLFYRLLECAPLSEDDKEPKFNLFSYYAGGAGANAAEGEYRAIVVFRERHWSHHYFSDGPDHLTMGLGCADMAGFFIVPVPEDFAKLTEEMLAGMVDEVSLSAASEHDIIWRLTRRQRTVDVGIMSAEEIVFEIISDGAGPQKVSIRDGRIDYNGVLYDELYFDAVTRSTFFAEPSFVLHAVTIGVDFHWERKLDQTFAGSLKFIAADNKILAINTIGVEDYLLSVISSEMKASAGLELLKAHAVISRSWLMSQLERPKGLTARSSECVSVASGEIVKWWDHDDHSLFDVCADDHCQRYQGLTMAVGDKVRKAIDATWGQVLRYDGEICDARFSKCCGGVTERFSTCWEDRDLPYLVSVPDTPDEKADGHCFCDTDDKAVLSQVLNDYDLETGDFFRWECRYSREELSELVERRSGLGLGSLRELIPLERGGSGRISRLKLVGDKGSMVIGKELMIRRTLSESHLKSSAFEIESSGEGFILRGKGWGHGVGLCQIGAAVMACRGYDYKQILAHYYPGAELTEK